MTGHPVLFERNVTHDRTPGTSLSIPTSHSLRGIEVYLFSVLFFTNTLNTTVYYDVMLNCAHSALHFFNYNKRTLSSQHRSTSRKVKGVFLYSALHP